MQEMRVAVLDDYQNVASGCADWDSLSCEVTFMSDHLAERSEIVKTSTGSMWSSRCGNGRASTPNCWIPCRRFDSS